MVWFWFVGLLSSEVGGWLLALRLGFRVYGFGLGFIGPRFDSYSGVWVSPPLLARGLGLGLWAPVLGFQVCGGMFRCCFF